MKTKNPDEEKVVPTVVVNGVEQTPGKKKQASRAPKGKPERGPVARAVAAIKGKPKRGSEIIKAMLKKAKKADDDDLIGDGPKKPRKNKGEIRIDVALFPKIKAFFKKEGATLTSAKAEFKISRHTIRKILKT